MTTSVLWHQLWIDSQLLSRGFEGAVIALGILVGCWLIARAIGRMK